MAKRVMTKEEQETNIQTQAHIDNVRMFVEVFTKALTERGLLHDASKLEDPELPAFTLATARLAGSTYGSPEYKQFLAELAPTLAHHYANNKHHPEHYEHGVEDMTLVDLVEMFCDWKAATLRHNDGNLLKSIKINAERFGISPQLTRIFQNTATLIDHIPSKHAG